MNAEELAAAVDELDTKLERLRVLMEQYFQGIEKIPPNIVQKDVDRRIWVLRREKIRNTGTRFRFQQIIQRYNTLGSYWMRILREIENGTYKRHVLRAKKRFGPDAVNEAAPDAAVPRPEARELDDTDLTDDLDELGDDLGDLGPMPAASISTALKAAAPAQRPPTPPLPRPPGPPPNRPSNALPAVPATPPVAAPPAALPSGAPPVAPPSASPAASRVATAPVVPAAAASAPVTRKVESYDDLDDMLDVALGPAAHNRAAPPPAAPPPQPRPPFVQQPRNPPNLIVPALARPGASGDEYRRVYSQYVEARRRNGESTAGITYETLARSLEQTKDKLREKSGGKRIEFEVAVKDGKTILKPVVR